MRQNQMQRQRQISQNEKLEGLRITTDFTKKEFQTALEIGLSPLQILDIYKNVSDLPFVRDDFNISDENVKSSLKQKINQHNKAQKGIFELLHELDLPIYSVEEAAIKIKTGNMLLNEENTVFIEKATANFKKANFEISKLIEKIRDPREINQDEALALRKAEKLNLFDKNTAEKFFMEAIQGTISPMKLEEIKEIQKALKADDKYSGEIDGKWGVSSREGLKNLIIENADALIGDSNQLQKSELQENEKSPAKSGRNH